MHASQRSPNQTLLNTAASGNVRKFEAALQAGADVNVHEAWTKDTPLILAVKFDHPNLVEKLLSAKNIDVNAHDRDGMSALIWASYRKDGFPLVSLLLQEKNININTQDNNGKTALMHALDSDNEGIDALLSHGIDVTLEDNKGRTAADYMTIFDFDDEATRKRRAALKEMLQKRIFEARKKKLEEKLPGMQRKKEKARKLLEEHSRSKVRELAKVLPDESAVTIQEEYVGQSKPERAMREVERREQARQKIEEKALKQSQEQ